MILWKLLEVVIQAEFTTAFLQIWTNFCQKLILSKILLEHHCASNFLTIWEQWITQTTNILLSNQIANLEQNIPWKLVSHMQAPVSIINELKIYIKINKATRL